MAKKLYLTSIEKRKGKSFVSLGFVSQLYKDGLPFQCFKLFSERDNAHFSILQNLTHQPVKPIMPISDAIALMRNQPDELQTILFDKVVIDEQKTCYFEGSDFESDNDMAEFQFNLSIAYQLNCEVILVVSGKDRQTSHIKTLIQSALDIAKRNHTNVRGVIINQFNLGNELETSSQLQSFFTQLCISIIPEFEEFAYPMVKDVAKLLSAKIIFGKTNIHRQVKEITVAAKTVTNFLQSRLDRKGMLIITPDDRMDILLGTLLADQSANYPKIAGIVLTGGMKPSKVISEIISGLEHTFPVMVTPLKTYETATTIHNAKFSLQEDDMDRVDKAGELMSPYIQLMLTTINKSPKTDEMNPALFLHNLSVKAKKMKKHIVLPEGTDIRILQAADYLLKREIVSLTVIGNPEKILLLAKQHDLSLPNLSILDLESAPNIQKYAKQYFKLRQHKNVNLPIAIERMADGNYYATMMVYFNHADGVVSGATHTTADTVRPALEIIKTKPGVDRVSSVFIMCLPTRVVIYGDCAINPEPDAKTLAEITMQAAVMAKSLDIDPRVALLSYSTGGSGHGASVDKVNQAIKLLAKEKLDYLVEGPIQYDAAVDMGVAKQKLPNSKVAGKANVLIFPDLNTGNNTYKAVQRESGALAIGPVLLGLNKPVNDLSRGCTVQDVINTILLTAIQASENSP
ncbi:phosphate acetyltransferase [Legionella sp. W05-934-2]|uniref:phosphate acetyltransferase n=1 Tax=Legionella sp. W05-934-2 TaxID=1198649 RepID=UPI003462ADA0